MTILSLVTIAFVVRYLAFNPDTYFPEQRQVYQQREFILGVHVLSGMLALLVGPFQFVSKIRHRFLRVHRSLGVVYIATILYLPTGLMGIPEQLRQWRSKSRNSQTGKLAPAA